MNPHNASQAGIAEQKREPKPTFDPTYIRDLSEKVYRLRLEQDCPGNCERMIKKDEDGGEKLRNRAGAYDPLTRAYLKVLGFEPSPHSRPHLGPTASVPANLTTSQRLPE